MTVTTGKRLMGHAQYGFRLDRTQTFATVTFPTVRTPAIEFRRGTVIIYFDKSLVRPLSFAEALNKITTLLTGIEFLPDDQIIPAFVAKARLIGSKYDIPIVNVRVINLR